MDIPRGKKGKPRNKLIAQTNPPGQITHPSSISARYRLILGHECMQIETSLATSKQDLTEGIEARRNEETEIEKHKGGGEEGKGEQVEKKKKKKRKNSPSHATYEAARLNIQINTARSRYGR